VLCSSTSHLPDPPRAAERFLEALGRAAAGRAVCFVAGADLAHLGPLYGDAAPAAPARLAAAAADDRRTLGFLEAGDAEGFRADASRDDARRRICGTAPVYAAMRASGRGARVLHYHQWSDGTDSVSFAAAAG
jgi:AmmeMemoRadiSam system protein B